jgi:hypothetical protein
MAQASPRAGFTGPALIRLLARLADRDVPPSKEGLAERLSHWLSWTDAVSLSTALSPTPASAPGIAPDRLDRPSRNTDAEEAARVRSTLAKANAEDGLLDTDDFPVYRLHYVTRQHAMEGSIAPLRARLRVALTRRSADMARLAAMDAVMEQALWQRERSLLATVPALLEKHFVRSKAQSGTFRKDMQAVLLAELELRLQPIEGLLHALRIK